MASFFTQLTRFTLLMAISGVANAALQNQQAPAIDHATITEPMRKFEWTIPPLTTAFYDTEPDKRKDGVAVGQLKESKALIALANKIAEGQHGKIDSLLIAQRGKLVFESYFNKGRINIPHPQASATKVYTSLAIGRAIQLGYLTMADLHKPLVGFLKDVDVSSLPASAKNLTLDHTLSMRSGFRFTEEQENSTFDNPEQLKGQKLLSFYFQRSQPVLTKHQKYHYQPSDPQLSMLVLEAVVPGSAKAFIKTELLDKLGITNYVWNDIPVGIPSGPSGSSMTSRDMIKWGHLFEQNGVWQGKQLISAEYLQRATSSVSIPVDDDFDYSNYRYGYFFWGTTFSVNNQSYDANLAWGGGNQMVMAIDALDLVIVITARILDDVEKTFEMIERDILPAFSKR